MPGIYKQDHVFPANKDVLHPVPLQPTSILTSGDKRSERPAFTGLIIRATRKLIPFALLVNVWANWLVVAVAFNSFIARQFWRY